MSKTLVRLEVPLEVTDDVRSVYVWLFFACLQRLQGRSSCGGQCKANRTLQHSVLSSLFPSNTIRSGSFVAQVAQARAPIFLLLQAAERLLS
jgi:hypothetical protein